MSNSRNRTSDRVPPAMMVVIVIVAVMAILLLLGCVRMMLTPTPEGWTPSTEKEPGGESDQPATAKAVFEPVDQVMLPAATDKTVTLTSEILAEHAVLVDAETGEILAQKDADTRFSPASMTKVMTLIVLCERIKTSDLARKVTFTDAMKEYVKPSDKKNGYYGSGCYGLDPYDEILLRDALYGIGVESDADCSILAMNYLTDSEEEFVGWMNEEAEKMGLKNTHFDNIIGYESPQNYTTASEMASILARALDCQLIREILSTPVYHFSLSGYNSKNEWVTGASGHFYSTLFNANKSNSSRFRAYGVSENGTLALEKATFGGGKTGTLTPTSNSWIFSLASFATAKSGGKTYIAVTGADSVNKGADPITDAVALYNAYLP